MLVGVAAMEAPMSALVHAAGSGGGVALAVRDDREVEAAVIACRPEYETEWPLRWRPFRDWHIDLDQSDEARAVRGFGVASLERRGVDAVSLQSYALPLGSYPCRGPIAEALDFVPPHPGARSATRSGPWACRMSARLPLAV